MIDQGIKMLEICGYGKLRREKKSLKSSPSPASQLCCCWPGPQQQPSNWTKDDQEEEGGHHPWQRWTKQPLYILHNQPNQVDILVKSAVFLQYFYSIYSKLPGRVTTAWQYKSTLRGNSNPTLLLAPSMTLTLSLSGVGAGAGAVRHYLTTNCFNTLTFYG